MADMSTVSIAGERDSGREQDWEDVPRYVDGILARAVRAGASDVHVEPISGGSEVRFRVDGVLTAVEKMPGDVGRSVALRLMVMANLLTYRLDIPQEGRIRWEMRGHTGEASQGEATEATVRLDLRLAMMPVAHGLRTVVRLPAELTQPRRLEDLGLPERCVEMLKGFARGDSGMLLVTGPAGSGKTTTIYALLEYIAKTADGVSVISLEDPIERLVDGITQIEVTPQGQLTYERALKSILRQDPQVLMLGEIRDAATASVAVQAALSGHRLIATLHAGDPAGAVARLLEMGVEPYQITSTVYGVLTQRLVRKLAAKTKQGWGEDASGIVRYRGRVPVAECGLLDKDVRNRVLARADADTLRNAFHLQPGHVTLQQMADQLVMQGITDQAEIRRVLGE
jgi:general secretion pathway protein E